MTPFPEATRTGKADNIGAAPDQIGETKFSADTYAFAEHELMGLHDMFLIKLQMYSSTRMDTPGTLANRVILLVSVLPP